MTPHQKLKHYLIAQSNAFTCHLQEQEITADNVDEIYDELDDAHEYKYDLREGDVETNIPCEYSRHYESKSVAVQTPDGSWVGWTYWYGGGKHGEPEAIDWMNKAYNLSCTEEQKLVTIQTFTKEE